MSRVIIGMSTSKGFQEAVPKADIAEYASEDTTKGTIDERLTALGFKEGSIALEDSSGVTLNEIKRQGNYVLGNLVFDTKKSVLAFDYRSGNKVEESILLGTIIGKDDTPAEYLCPKEDITFGVAAQVEGTIRPLNTSENFAPVIRLTCTIKTTGEVFLNCYAFINSSTITTNYQYTMNAFIININFGYEAEAILNNGSSGDTGDENTGTEDFNPDGIL